MKSSSERYSGLLDFVHPWCSHTATTHPKNLFERGEPTNGTAGAPWPDFRDACKKYRRFVHWLDKEIVGKSRVFIEDEIAVKLEDYESVLKKHGIRTVLGTIQEVLDAKYLMPVVGVSGSFALAGHATLGILTGAGLIVGKVGVKLGLTFLDLHDVEYGPNSEISWVYEVKQLGG